MEDLSLFLHNAAFLMTEYINLFKISERKNTEKSCDFKIKNHLMWGWEGVWLLLLWQGGPGTELGDLPEAFRGHRLRREVSLDGVNDVLPSSSLFLLCSGENDNQQSLWVS